MFDEIKEMIDSTIYTNGRGEVTAQNINLAMHGVVDATEEELGKVNDAVKTVEDKVTALEENGTGGGAGALRVWLYETGIEELTPEQVNENIATYNSLLKDVAQPVVISMYYNYSDAEMSVTIGQSLTCSVAVQVAESGGQTIDSQVILGAPTDFDVILSPDGTTEIVPKSEEVYDPGPYYCYVPEEGATLSDSSKSSNRDIKANNVTNIRVISTKGGVYGLEPKVIAVQPIGRDVSFDFFWTGNNNKTLYRASVNLDTGDASISALGVLS